MIRGIHHTSISTQNFDRLVHFYRNIIGLEYVASYDRDADSPDKEKLDKIVGLKGSTTRTALLRAGNTHVEISQYLSPKGSEGNPERRACDAGLTHVSFDVVDVFSEYERLRRAGVKFHTEPETVGTFRATYGRDPDGNIFELQEVMDPTHPVALTNLVPELAKA
jgi:catechol 2,3-dioxygenase-like lactoylglutathione lyase family enzyme